MSSQASEATRPRTRSPMRPRERKWILVAHIAASVGLLGDTAAILVLGAVAGATGDAHLANAAYTFMRLLIPMFGIPLTFVALASGLVLALGTGTGGLGPFWVRAKLLFALGVVAVGAFLLAPVAFRSGPPHGAASAIVGASLDVAALLSAVSLAVFKPIKAVPRLRRSMPSAR
jgi:hypothetical protein